MATERDNARIPVSVLTGFLGSGKTTLLRRLLTDPGMDRTAVLINEFGEIGLDHLLVKSVLDGAVVLQNGCICCTLRTDLREGIVGILDSRYAGTFPDFDRIVVETTGLADPAPIAQTLLIDPMLRNQVQLANIVTTVDGMLGARQLGTHEESLRQAAVADRLVITKTDMVEEQQTEALKSALTRLNPTARIFDVNSNSFSAEALLTSGVSDPATKLAEVQHWLSSTEHAHLSGEDERACHGEHDHRHDRHVHLGGNHSVDIQSFSLRVEQDIDWTAFGIWLTLLLHRHGANILRVKGLLRVPDAAGPIVLHGVQHVIHPPVHLDAWPDDDHASRLVFIVQGIDPALLRRSLLADLRAADT
jgi:G3E family GTPase